MMIVIIIFAPVAHLTCCKRITIQRGRNLPNMEFQLIPFPALASTSLYVGRAFLYVAQHFHSPPFSWFSFLNGTVPPMICNKRPLNFGHQSMSIHLCHNVQDWWLFLHLISNCFMNTLSTYYTINFSSYSSGGRCKSEIVGVSYVPKDKQLFICAKPCHK